MLLLASSERILDLAGEEVSVRMRTETRVGHLSMGLVTAQDVIVHISLLVFSEMLYTGLQGEKQERRKNKSFATLRTAQAALAIAGRKVRVRGRRCCSSQEAEKMDHSLNIPVALEDSDSEEALTEDKLAVDESITKKATSDPSIIVQDDLGKLFGYLASECERLIMLLI